MGFPNRTARDQLGPTLQDQYPVQNPRTQVGAASFNTTFWQMAGMNLVVPRTALLASWNGSAFDVTHQAEAWNPDAAQAHPVLARGGTGNYTYTFAGSYLDENGVAQPTVLLAARISDRKVLSAFADRLEPRAWIDGSDPLVVQIRLWDTSGTLVDQPFWLEVF